MIAAKGSGLPTTEADIVLRSLARRAMGLSGADIERLVREARQSARRERRSVTWPDLDRRLSALKPQRSEELRWRMAVHEAGHAIARTVLGLGVITLITIDGVDGGRVESEESLHVEETEDRLTSLLIAKLAGRAAEEVFFGSCVAGSGGGPDSDLATATSIALQMEVSLGYGADMPLLYRDPERYAPILINRRDVADRVNSRLEKGYADAKHLIQSHRTAVKTLARALIAKATLEGEDLYEVLSSPEADAYIRDPGRQIVHHGPLKSPCSPSIEDKHLTTTSSRCWTDPPEASWQKESEDSLGQVAEVGAETRLANPAVDSRKRIKSFDVVVVNN